MVALSNVVNQSLTLAIIFKAHLEQISFVSAGRRSVQLATDFLRTSPTVSATKSGRSQWLVLVATDSVTVTPSFRAVPTTFLARILLKDISIQKEDCGLGNSGLRQAFVVKLIEERILE